MDTNDARDAAGALPDELLLDIFERLADPVDLLRSAGTCRRWLRLLAADDAAVLQQAGVLPVDRKATILLGAFFQNDYGVVPWPTDTVNKSSDCTPLFWRLHGKPPGDNVDHPCFGMFSILLNNGGLFNYAKPLASQGGLLLVRLMPVPFNYQNLHLAVCHPLLGGVHHVPPPPVVLHPLLLGGDLTGYALLTGYGGEGLHNHRQRRLAFRVLLTAVRLNGVMYAYSYSSATGRWSASSTCHLDLGDLTMSGPRAGVVDGCGTTHWLYSNETSFYTLNVSANAERVSCTRILIHVGRSILSRGNQLFPCITGGGKVSFAFTTKSGYDTLLKLWTKREDQDGNDEGWICSVLAMTHSHRPCEPFKIIGFAESRGALLIKSNAGLSCLDLESKELELIKGSEYSTYPREVSSDPMCQGYNSCTECAYNNTVLYEIDWSSYLLHMSAWSQGGATVRHMRTNFASDGNVLKSKIAEYFFFLRDKDS